MKIPAVDLRFFWSKITEFRSKKFLFDNFTNDIENEDIKKLIPS